MVKEEIIFFPCGWGVFVPDRTSDNHMRLNHSEV